MNKGNEEEERRSYRKRVDLSTTNDGRDEYTGEKETMENSNIQIFKSRRRWDIFQRLNTLPWEKGKVMITKRDGYVTGG